MMRRTGGVLLDAVVVLLVLATLALPVGALAAAGALPTPPQSVGDTLPPIVRGQALPIRTAPTVVAGGAADAALTEGRVLTSATTMRRTIDTLGRQLFVGGSTVQFWAALADPEEFYRGVPSVFPFRYPALDPVLDRLIPRPLTPPAVQRLTDMAALLTVSSEVYRFGDDFPESSMGASAAMALLSHARTIVDSCDVQLNLAFLASADAKPQDDKIAAEFDRAQRLCPGDPTPPWLLGQFQLSRTYVGRDPIRFGQVLDRDTLTPRPVNTFERLQREIPSSPAGWAGLADAEMFLAENSAQLGVQPFTARHRYAHALALYDRAAALANDDPSRIGSDVGRVRALAGLGRVDEAAAAAQQALDRAPQSGPLQTVRADALERAGRFAEAASALRGFAARPVELPAGRALTTTPAISIGVDSARWELLTVGPPLGGGAGIIVYDYAFMPRFREDQLTRIDPWCRGFSRVRDLVLAGQANEAVRALGDGHDVNVVDDRHSCSRSGDFIETYVGPGSDRVDSDTAQLGAVATAEAGRPGETQDWLDNLTDLEDGWLEDTRQNLWRFAGDLGRARAIVDQWRADDPGNPLAWERTGEVAFLQGRHAEAAGFFAESVRRQRDDHSVAAILTHADNLLRQGTAEALADQTDQAVKTLGSAEQAGLDARREIERRGGDFDFGPDSNQAEAGYLGTMVAHYARMQLGDLALRRQDFAAAERAYTGAAKLIDEFDFRIDLDRDGSVFEDQPHRFRNGAAENNLALALIGQGKGAAALPFAKTAVTRDPQSPIFLQMLAYANQGAGDDDAAIDLYRQALTFDPTLFPVENDLAVILAGHGHTDEAIAELRRAVGAEPGYALGWFNLGVLLSRLGPAHFLEAQGALGRAAHLDSSLRGRELTLSYDREPYYSGLDLSRPLPPAWQFATGESRSPAVITVVALVLLLLRLVWSLGLDQGSGKLAERVLPQSRVWRFIGRPVLPLLAVAATVAVFVIPMLFTPRPPAIDTLVVGLGVLALVGLYTRTRIVAARAVHEDVRHYTWPPAIVFGAALGAAGLAFAPVPVAGEARHRWVRWSGPLALAVVAAVLLGLAWWTGVPTVRSVGSASLVMISTALLPARPFDGAYLTHRVVNVVITVLLLAASALLLLGWV